MVVEKGASAVIATAADTWWRALLAGAPAEEVLPLDRPPTSYYFVPEVEEA
jgi:hypothetical protein